MSSAMNVYTLADERQARARCDTEGRKFNGLLPMLAAAALVPLLWHAGWYGWLDLAGSPRAIGASVFALRVSFVLAIAVTLGTYDTIVRGPDRGVVDLHPLLAVPYLRARIRRVVIERGVWVGVGGVLCLPAIADPVAAIGCFVVVSGAAFAGLGLGLGINLGAARMAADPRWAGLMDVIRGSNPREQAPFLYAPGLAVALVGAAVVAAQQGLTTLLAGGVPWLLVAPWLAGALGMWLAFSRAKDLSRLPAVLGEIDARWAGVEDEEDARRVYLEWVADRAPGWLREELRKELRHGWRAHRTLVLGGWGLGAFAAAIVMAEGPRWVALAGTGAMVVTAMVGPRLALGEPPLLELFYPRPHVRTARTVAVWSWLWPCAIGALAAGGLKGGSVAGVLATVGMLFLVPWLAARLSMRSYLPLALGLCGLAAGVV